MQKVVIININFLQFVIFHNTFTSNKIINNKNLEFEAIIIVVKATNLEVGIIIEIGSLIETRTKIEANAQIE